MQTSNNLSQNQSLAELSTLNPGEFASGLVGGPQGTSQPPSHLLKTLT